MKLREKHTVYGDFFFEKVAGNFAPKFDVPKLLLQNVREEEWTVAKMSWPMFPF